VTNGTLATSRAQQADVIPVGELEIGGEYSRDLGRYRLFAQAGLVGQVWWGAGNAANNNSGGSPNNSSDLGFLGFVFRGGISF
jgi:hypothetical protein